MNCEYGGTLVKGDNFGIRVVDEGDLKKMLAPFEEMGCVFAEKASFECKEAKAFTGPEVFSLPMRLLLQLMFKTIAKSKFKKVAEGWGCTKDLADRPYEV